MEVALVVVAAVAGMDCWRPNLGVEEVGGDQTSLAVVLALLGRMDSSALDSCWVDWAAVAADQGSYFAVPY